MKRVSEIQQTPLGDNLTKQASPSTIASLLHSLQFPHYLGGAYVHRLSDVQLKLKGAAYKMQTKMFTVIKKKTLMS